MKKYALIGKNIQDSLSPIIHGAYGCQYDLLDIEEDKLEWALSLPYDGFNVTSPYKEKICKFLNSFSGDALPVNLISNHDGELRGYNTDSWGFIRAIKMARVDVGRVGIIGNGGAAKAIQSTLNKISRTPRMINSRIAFSEQIRQDGDCILKDLTGIINCTPYQDYNLTGLSKEAFVMDLGYKDDTFIKAARARGNFAFNGMGMLIAQAEESQRIWNS